jgi:hypothetical protein
VALEEVSEGGPLKQRLGLGVDHLRSRAGVRRPVGDQTPAHESRVELIAFAPSADGNDLVGRGDVVAVLERLDPVSKLGAEATLDLAPILGEAVAAAHASQRSPCASWTSCRRTS